MTLHTTVILSGVLTFALVGAAPAADPDQRQGADAAKPLPAETKSRSRRVIYNFDGDSCLSTKAGGKGPVAVTVEDVKRLIEEVAHDGSQVETVLVCINAQVMYYPTKVGTMRGTLSSADERAKWPAGEKQRFENLRAFFAGGVDPYAIMLAEAKRRGREALLTFRMNDDHGNDFLRTRFFADHPEWRLGADQQRASGAMDFGRDEVRDYTFRLIEEAVRRYDCDGIELDFNRFPTFFKDGSTDERVAKMNSLVERVRKMLDDVGRERGRRLVLAARVPSNYGRTPPTPETSLQLGCDVPAWVKNGWIDFVTVSEFLFERGDLPIGLWKQAITTVPVYGGIECTKGGGQKNLTAEEYRQAAANLLKAGADGVYLFNFFTSREEGADAYEPPFEVLRDLAGAATPISPAVPSPARAEEPADRLSFKVQADVLYRQLSPDFCWFHPRAAALPGHGKDGQPAVVVTLQKHLAADDHYSGGFFMRTDDLGKTWSGPTEVPELAWRKGPDNLTIAVANGTPGWHAPSGRMIAIGGKILYTAAGDYASLEKLPRSYEVSYATYDPAADKWTPWRELEMPETDGKFRRVGCGCSQWLVQSDGTLLVPVEFQPAIGADYQVTVLHCGFDGQEMKYLGHGDELAITGGRGFAEPSLAFLQGKFYMTLRNDARAYVTTSGDGLHFEPVKAWTFDDGQDLGSYNTQAHWLVHNDGLFLSYTRRGANNDHIARNRAPIFVAQVDPVKLQVLRGTEQVLLPERGVMLGNFGAAAITPNESWVTDAEFISRLVDPQAGTKPHPRGADGTVWLGRVKWSKPN